MVVKRNQAQVYQELGWYVATPPLPCDRPWRIHRTLTNGHGRLEDRVLTCGDDLDDLTWPDGQHVVQRTCERSLLKTSSVRRPRAMRSPVCLPLLRRRPRLPTGGAGIGRLKTTGMRCGM